MTSWIRDNLLSSIYEDILQRRLLEEIDADSLNYLILRKEKSVSPSLPILFGGIAISSAGLYLGKFSYASLGLALTAVGGVASYLTWRLTSVPKLISSSIISAKTMHKVLQNRERITFGLGISSSFAQRQLRMKVFLILREYVYLLERTTKALVIRFPLEEQHLLSNFYSKEILQLLHEEVTIDSHFISDGGICTLIDISILHISELCRLYVLSLAHLRIFNYLELISIFYSFNRDLRPILKQFSDLSQSPSNEAAIRTIKSEAEKEMKVETYEAVALALEGISSSILSKSLSPEETHLALRKIMQMDWLRQAEKQEDLEEKETPKMERREEEMREINQIITTNVPAVDQVFEAFVEEKELQAAYYDEDYSLEQKVINSSLMGELRMALTDRSKEFEQRERKALATFYGISEEELQKREEEKKEEIQLETMGEAVEEETWQPERRAPLAVELLQALAKRGPIKEAILGDSSDED